MNDVILSVSVAAYNVEKYLVECLNSFIDPALGDMVEVLIVDDGATDSTPEIARQYQEKYPRVFRHIHKENGGWGSTLNVGIKEARGKYFKQLDGDDYFTAEELPAFLEALKSTDADIVYTPFATFIDGQSEPFQRSSFDDRLKKDELLNIDAVLEQGISLPIEMHTLTVRTALLQEHYESVQLQEHCFYTDVEFWLKSGHLAQTCQCLDNVIYRYRIGRSGQSVSLEGVRKHYKEHQHVLDVCARYLEKVDCTPAKKAFLENRLAIMVFSQLQYYFLLPICKQTKQELKAFVADLQKNHPALMPKKHTTLSLLRCTGFLTYRLLAPRSQRKALADLQQ